VLHKCRSERLQQQSQRRIEPDFLVADVNMALHTAAVKMQCIAMPFATETMLGSQRIGRFLHLRSGLRDRQRMASDKRDIGHTLL